MGSERRDIWTKRASLRELCGGGWRWGARARLYADPVGGLGLAVEMEARMTEMKSEPLGPLGKALVSLATA